MHFESAAKYVTEIGQPTIFGIVEISKKWYDSLPADLQQIIDKDAAAESVTINPQAIAIDAAARKAWLASGGELISLPDDEQSSLLKIVAGVGDEVSNAKPELNAAYKVVTEAAQRVR
jgi:TRAP-type transport system periplasmic protein